MFMVGLRLGDKFAQLGEITEEEMDFFLTTLAVTAVYLSVVFDETTADTFLEGVVTGSGATITMDNCKIIGACYQPGTTLKPVGR